MTLDRPLALVARRTLRVLVAAACTWPALAGAEAVFFEQISPGTSSAPLYFSGQSHEMAEDLPFTGTQQLSSFTFGYRASIPVRVTFRFYGVNASTTLPGVKLAELVRELPVGAALATITLSPEEQFAFSAQPNLYPGSAAYSTAVAERTGGWYSITFATLDGSLIPPDTGLRMAQHTVSYSYLLDMTTGKSTGISDANGTAPQGMYLRLCSSASTNVPLPTVAGIVISPPSVKSGTSAKMMPVMAYQAPHGGTVVKMKSSNPRAASVPSEVTVPAGSSTLLFSANTGRVRKTEVVTISAEANGSSAAAVLTVTP